MKKFLKTVKNALFGASVGLVNGLFGAGGGLICVPLLIKSGMPRKQAHANAVAIILAVSTVSAGSYLLAGRVQLTDCLPYLPGGLAGAFVGTQILKKINPDLIRRIFALFMLWAGWRLLFQ